jgi:hypothetical protein
MATGSLPTLVLATLLALLARDTRKKSTG